MPVVFMVWLAVASAVCEGTTEAGEARAAAMWWGTVGEDLVRTWARKEEAITVTLVTIAGVFVFVGVWRVDAPYII